MHVLPAANRTVPDLVSSAAGGMTGAWLSDDTQTLGAGQAQKLITEMALQLRQLGVGRGDRVCLVARNSARAVLALLAVMRAHAVAVPLDPGLSPDARLGLLRRANARLVLTDDMVPDAPCPVVRLDEIAPGGAQAAEANATLEPVSPEDPALVIFSSGSTGEPKGVVLSHRALVLTAETTAWHLELGDADVIATTNPLFHVNAIAFAMLASLAARVRFRLYSRFSASLMWQRAHEDRVSVLVLAAAAIPMWWDRLKEAPVQPRLRMRAILAGGAPREVAEGIRARTGARIHIGYALSECPVGLLAPPASEEGAPGTPYIGHLPRHPASDVEFRAEIVDESGNAVPDGATGEIALGGPVAMTGYLDDPNATAGVLRDGWVMTGDLGRKDESGAFWYVGRRKELLRRHGEMFAPAEVERVLKAHPAARDAAVVRIGNGPGVGEDAFAGFIETGHVQPPAEGELAAWCRARLPSHKCPDHFVACAEFPRSGLSKPLKKQLAAMHFGETEEPTP